MGAVERRRSPVDHQLEAYEESWTKDHAEALLCRDWEDAIAVGVTIFHLLREREQTWRDRVFRGTLPYTRQEDTDNRARWAEWLDTTNRVLAERLPDLERKFGSVEGAGALRTCAGLAQQILAGWQPPRLSAAVGLREMTLSPEAAVELDRLLEEGKRLAPDPPRPRMQELPAAELKRRP